MIEAVLFDLDDTLLGNHMDDFLPGYFGLLSKHVSQIMDPKRFLELLLAATDAMVKHTDTAVSNRDAFWQAYQQMTGDDPAKLEPFFARFYEETFPELAPLTTRRPEAVQLVQNCLDDGLKVVVATNPMFPTLAIEHRLAWAGLPVDKVPFALVTTYDNMHATKPHIAYYEEILAKIGCAPETAVMVGNDWENDIVPAHKLGLATFWISDGDSPPDLEMVQGFGTLAQLAELVASGWLELLPAEQAV